MCANFSTFRLSDLSICWEVGKLAGCGGFLVYRRGKRASAQEEGLLGGRGSGAAGSGTFGRVTADAPLLPAAGWCARWVWSTRGGKRRRTRRAQRGQDAVVQGKVAVFANLPTCRLVDFSTFRFVGKLESWRGAGCQGWVAEVSRRAAGFWFTRRGKEKKSRGSDCRVQSLHCAITISGGWQPARCWWCARQLSNIPTFRLLGLLALWLVVGTARGGGTAKP